MMKKKSQSLVLKDKLNDLIHFIRTPLASIKSGVYIIKELLPTLIEVYEKSLEFNLIENKISEVKLRKLNCVLNNILDESERISHYVNDIEHDKV